MTQNQSSPGWLPPGYHVVVEPLPCEPDEYQEYYWKLYFEDERINGGITENPLEGRVEGSRYAFQHHRGAIVHNPGR